MSNSRGFTLIETLMAIAILALLLMSGYQIQAQVIAARVYARQLTTASLLAESKVIDLEQKLLDEGFNADDEEVEGDFSDDGNPDFRWSARILVPRVQDLDTSVVLGTLLGLPSDAISGLSPPDAAQSAGGSKPSGALLAAMEQFAPNFAQAGKEAEFGKALDGFNPIAGAAEGQVQTFLTQAASGLRRIELTVSWGEKAAEESFQLSTTVIQGAQAPLVPQTPLTNPGTGVSIPGQSAPGLPNGLPGGLPRGLPGSLLPNAGGFPGVRRP